jgi:hypothetical protein
MIGRRCTPRDGERVLNMAPALFAERLAATNPSVILW